MRVLILSKDAYLIRKFELELEGIAETANNTEVSDVTLYDCESGIACPTDGRRIIRLSRDGREGAVSLPLERGKIKELIRSESTEKLSLFEADKTAVFKDKRIKLTSHEYSLLSLLLSKGGYISRDEIAKKVWGEATDGLINIYIHYLREKLESDGDKVIISSRKFGYKINEKYTEGDLC